MILDGRRSTWRWFVVEGTPERPSGFRDGADRHEARSGAMFVFYESRRDRLRCSSSRGPRVSPGEEDF
jgi:hypothetical protein